MRSLAIVLALLALTPGALAAYVALPTVSTTPLPVHAHEASPAPVTRVASAPAVAAEPMLTGAAQVADALVADATELADRVAPLRLVTDPHGAKFARLERQAASASLFRAAPRAPDALPPTRAPPMLATDDAIGPPARPSEPESSHAPAPAASSDAEARRGPDASAAAVAAGAASLSIGLALALLALYHRLRGADVLDHGARARIAELLRTRPGITPAEVAREIAIDPSTALYHLRRMVKEGVAVCEGERRASRYFAPGSVPSTDRARIVMEREAAPVLDAIRREPGVSKTRLAERLAIARATLAWHLARLERNGLVRYERDGREVKVYPA